MAKLIPRNYYVYLRPITTVKDPTTEVLNGSDQVQIRTARQDRAFFGDLWALFGVILRESKGVVEPQGVIFSIRGQ